MWSSFFIFRYQSDLKCDIYIPSKRNQHKNINKVSALLRNEVFQQDRLKAKLQLQTGRHNDYIYHTLNMNKRMMPSSESNASYFKMNI